jgi:hypothetical protein
MMLDINKFNEVYNKIKIISENDLKHVSKKTMINNLYKLLETNKIQNIYTDEYWQGVRKLEKLLREFGVEYELQSANYYRLKDSTSQLPNGKKYTFDISFTDNEQKTHHVPLIVNCAFVGKTGTMEDNKYELTYYFAV